MSSSATELKEKYGLGVCPIGKKYTDKLVLEAMNWLDTDRQCDIYEIIEEIAKAFGFLVNQYDLPKFTEEDYQRLVGAMAVMAYRGREEEHALPELLDLNVLYEQHLSFPEEKKKDNVFSEEYKCEMEHIIESIYGDDYSGIGSAIESGDDSEYDSNDCHDFDDDDEEEYLPPIDVKSDEELYECGSDYEIVPDDPLSNSNIISDNDDPQSDNPLSEAE